MDSPLKGAGARRVECVEAIASIRQMEKPNGPGIEVFAGRAVSVRVDPVIVGDRQATREVVERVAAVGIIAEDSDGHIVVIFQYRWPIQRWCWELPAGKIDPGESALEAAQRELAEETGYHAEYWESVLEFYPSPGYSTERMTVFYARELTATTPEPEEDEDIQTVLWDRAQLEQHLRRNDGLNALWVVAVQWWLNRPRNP